MKSKGRDNSAALVPRERGTLLSFSISTFSFIQVMLTSIYVLMLSPNLLLNNLYFAELDASQKKFNDHNSFLRPNVNN